MTATQSPQVHTSDGSDAGARVFVRRVQGWSIASGAAVGVLLAALWSGDVGYGFLAGLMLGVVNFQLMAVDAYTLADRQPKSARKFIIGRMIVRFVILFGFLGLIALRTDWNIFAAFIGVLYSRMVLIGMQIITPSAGTVSRG